MSDWKGRFPANIRYEELPTIGPFRILNAPEPLGKGKYRASVDTPKREYQLTTYEATIGDIVVAMEKTGWCKAEAVKDTAYVNFVSCEPPEPPKKQKET